MQEAALPYSTEEISGTRLRKDSVYDLNSKFPTAGIFFHLMLLIQGNTIKSPGADLYWSVPGKQTRNAAFSLKLLLITRRGKLVNEVQS